MTKSLERNAANLDEMLRYLLLYSQQFPPSAVQIKHEIEVVANNLKSSTENCGAKFIHPENYLFSKAISCS